MAVLDLDRVWINRLDTGEAVAARSRVERDQSWADDGDVRPYAGGRRRSVTMEGESGRFRFSLRDVTLTQLATLRSWKGLAVQVRDARGQRFFGVFFTVDVLERRAPTLYDVSIPLDTITFDESV